MTAGARPCILSKSISIGFSQSSSISAPDFQKSREKAKSPLAELCASGLGFPVIAWLSAFPRRHAHRMVMVVTAMVQRSMGQRSHVSIDTRAAQMSLSIGFPGPARTAATNYRGYKPQNLALRPVHPLAILVMGPRAQQQPAQARG